MRKIAINRILGLVCVLFCICALSVPCLAVEIGSSGPMFMESITTIQCKIVVKDGKVTGQASMSGQRGVDRSKISMVIQRKDGNKWVSAGSWSEETTGRNASMTKTVAAKKGSTYRVSITVTAWNGNKAETKTMTSSEKTA